MTEVLLPTWIVPEEETHEWLDEGSAVFNAAFAPGIAQRQSFGGLRLKMSRRHTVRTEEKAQLLSILQSTRGRFNALRTKVHFERRGSGLGTEILTNNTFANGTTGWTTGADFTSSVSDRIYRATVNANAGSALSLIRTSSTVSISQYAPYAIQTFTAGRFHTSGIRVVFRNSGATALAGGVGSTDSDLGMLRYAMAPYESSVHASVSEVSASGREAAQFVDIPYISMARCLLVDAGLNSLLQSDELDATWSASFASVDDQSAGTTAPDGTSTADSIIEDSTTNVHRLDQDVTVSSAELDYCFGVAIKAGARTWARLSMLESTGGTTLQAYFDLSTGVVGTTGTGANWANIRTSVVSLGNGWYACYIVGRKTSAGTTITARIATASADNTASYLGDGTSNIYAWRATLVQSSVPTRLVQTTTTASTGTVPASGATAMHVKGLPASTNGLLLPGDWFEINGELKQCAAPLNSDAAGLGYLQFEPPLVRAPANDDPVIVTDPMGKFLVSNIQIQNEFGTQAVVTYDLEHIYE
jgi:hypothetical protein